MSSRGLLRRLIRNAWRVAGYPGRGGGTRGERLPAGAVAKVAPLFDEAWYRSVYPDVASDGIDPVRHFLLEGTDEGRSPHPLFDVPFYLAENPDVAASGVNPLLHYLAGGGAEGRRPHRMFDPGWYRARETDLAPGADPLLHYLGGRSRSRRPHPLFDGAWYLEAHPDVAASGLDPLVHYVAAGAAERRSPHPLFDAAWYLAAYRDVAEAGVDPLVHFLGTGHAEGRRPHPLFDTAFYLSANPDVAGAGLNPLLHYVATGGGEDRAPHRLFDPVWYRARHLAGASDIDPLVHYVTQGARAGLQPHPLFDPAWYLERNADVALAGLDPLTHFVTKGAAEGRDPHPLFRSGWYAGVNPDAAKSGLSPIEHYLALGARQGRAPNPLFEAAWYAASYAGADPEAGRNPLAHYLSEEGRGLGTQPNRYFDREWYLKTYRDVAEARLEPLAHFLENGSREGRDPGPRFSTGWYLRHCPDVSALGFDALSHFLASGEAEGRDPLPPGGVPPDAGAGLDLTEWVAATAVSPAGARLQERLARNFASQPLISIIVPVYIVQGPVFRKLLDSVLRQSYPRWELCIAVSYFGDDVLLETIERARRQDGRIKVRELAENRGISHNSNDALALATGEFVALLDHDDELPREALFEMVKAINADEGDLYYSDKDAISEDGRLHFNPLLKAQWSPETMLAANYLTHFNVMRRSLLDRIGGWDPATDGAQDWDLFLRLAAAGARIRHVPRMLYHWRHVQTSVAAGGLAVKPYAARGQLLAVERWLVAQGWSGVAARHDARGHLRLAWNRDYRPSVAILLFGEGETERSWRLRLEASPYGPATGVTVVRDGPAALWAAMEAQTAEILVVAPARLVPTSPDWFAELVGPLQNARIAAVAGKVTEAGGAVLDAGWVGVDGQWRPIFRGGPDGAYGAFGSVDWMRNYSTLSLNGVAVRRSALTGRAEPATGRPDLDLFLGIAGAESRLVYNPAATSVSEMGDLFEAWLPRDLGPAPAAEPDPLFNANLVLDGQGQPVLRRPPPRSAPRSHDYEGEAGYFGSVLDEAEPDLRDAPRLPASASPSERRIAWVVPHFSMPFYGGVLTILRAAEHMRGLGFKQVFLGLDTTDPAALRGSIARAFPDLAADSEVHGIGFGSDLEALGIGPLDAAFATLWTTAYIVQRLKRVRRKFYFVQDYEPLFYQAGTTSSLVEATYRFGFYGVCNTEPLSRLYRDFGSPADHFLPAVDRSIFHQEGRREARDGGPVNIFSYARPGHPRNCFELLAPALGELKKELGGKIEIYTAGADWSPAEYGLAGAVEHLGLLSYTETASLYRACDIGMVAMATCHPSYLPFELMATGAIVCTNFNRHTGWLLEHGSNCYQFQLSKRSIRESLRTVASDAGLRRRLRANAATTIDGFSSWQASCETIAGIILREIDAAV